MKKFFALALAIVMTLSLVACGKQEAPATAETEQKQEEVAKTKIDEIKAAGKLVMGTSADYPPAEFHIEIDGKDTIVGYDVEIAKWIAEDLGVELEVVDMSFDGLCISLSKGDFDVVLAGMSATDERKQAVDFTEPYFKAGQAILDTAETADQYNTIDDLKGKKIGYQSGTIQAGVLEELGLMDNAVALTNAQNIVMELKAGKLDVAYIDYMPSLAFEAADASLKLKDVGIVYDGPGEAIAVQKGNDEFLAYLNEKVVELNESGKLEQLIAEAQLLAGIE